MNLPRKKAPNRKPPNPLKPWEAFLHALFQKTPPMCPQHAAPPFDALRALDLGHLGEGSGGVEGVEGVEVEGPATFGGLRPAQAGA